MSRSKLLMNTNEVALAREVELPNRVGIGIQAMSARDLGHVVSSAGQHLLHRRA